jgi:hypothetical protein
MSTREKTGMFWKCLCSVGFCKTVAKIPVIWEGKNYFQLFSNFVEFMNFRENTKRSISLQPYQGNTCLNKIRDRKSGTEVALGWYKFIVLYCLFLVNKFTSTPRQPDINKVQMDRDMGNDLVQHQGHG